MPGAFVISRLEGMTGVVVDPADSIIVAECEARRVRKSVDWILTTVAGNGAFQSSGDGESFYNPWLLSVMDDSFRAILTDGNYHLIEPSNRARTGQVVTIWCTGLGAVNSSVTIGGINTRKPLFVGLAPNLVGVYHINGVGPQTCLHRDQIPVQIAVSGQSSVTVPTSLQ